MATPPVTATPAVLDPRELLMSNMDLIRRIVRAVARRQRLGDPATEELESAVWLRLVEHDYRTIRQYQGRSSFGTFLTVVVMRLAVDVQSAEWGRWRPSSRARRLGDTAVRFETLVFRDGYSRDEAASVLQMSTHAAPTGATRALATTRRSMPRRYVPIELVAHTLQTFSDPAESLLADERRSRVTQIAEVLRQALRGLSGEDQLLLRMRHAEGLKVSTIARVLGVDQKTLYRKLAIVHRRLQRVAVRAGVTRADARNVGRSDVEWPALPGLTPSAAAGQASTAA